MKAMLQQQCPYCPEMLNLEISDMEETPDADGGTTTVTVRAMTTPESTAHVWTHAPKERVGEIEARLNAAAPNSETEWAAGGDPGDKKMAPAWIVDADDIEIRMPATYKAGKLAAFIANVPEDVRYLLAELRKRDEALDRVRSACDRIINNADGHKPPGPPNPTREQATAVRIRAAVEARL